MRLGISLQLLFILQFSVCGVFAANAVAKDRSKGAQPKLENYKDLIEKARNLALQRDRLQASQVLVRGLKQESKTSPAYKEMAKSLDELSGIFYTEKGQMLFSLAESIVDSKPREALESYQAALRVEDGNVSILKALARAHLSLGECDSAATNVTQAEKFHPVSAEVRLILIQVAECSGQFSRVAELLAATEIDLSPIDKFLRSHQIRDSIRKKDLKKARTIVSSWEVAQPEYPEVYFWKWKLSSVAGAPGGDRSAAQKYTQLCRNLSPRAKKTYSLDLELCKQREAVEEFLKSGELQEAVTSGDANG